VSTSSHSAHSPAPAQATQAGWRPDPQGGPDLKYWDGKAWTDGPDARPMPTAPPLLAGAQPQVDAWYWLGVLLPLALTATSPWWSSVLSDAVGGPAYNTPAVAWMLVAGWIPWGVACGMAVHLAARFEQARRTHVPGAVGWHRIAITLLILTGVFGALFSLTLLSIASMFGHPGAPPMGP